MGTSTVAVVCNANAGKGTSREGLGLHVARMLARPDLIFATESVDELPGVMARIDEAGADVIVPAGGDGTHTALLTAMMRHYLPRERSLPDIALMPLGTVLVAAQTLGLKGSDPRDLARKYQAEFRGGDLFDRLTLNPVNAGGRYGMLYGFGMPVHVLQRYYDGKYRGIRRIMEVGASAFLHEASALLRGLPSEKPLTSRVHAKVTMPGNDPSVCPHHEHVMLGFAAIDQVGLGCRAMPDAMGVPGRIKMRSWQLEYWEMVRHLPEIWTGKPLPKTFDAHVRHARVDFTEAAQPMLDGELLEPVTRVDVRAGPDVRYLSAA